MKTYNFGRIEILRDLKSELKGIAPFSPTEGNRERARVTGRDIQDVEVQLYKLGFRLPTIKECDYLYRTFKDLGMGNLVDRRFWVDTDLGAQILLIRDSDLSIWSNATETLPHTLFAVRDVE